MQSPAFADPALMARIPARVSFIRALPLLCGVRSDAQLSLGARAGPAVLASTNSKRPMMFSSQALDIVFITHD